LRRVFELTREVPDTLLAERFDGEPMVQSFTVAGLGSVWITTADALTIPAFGRPWVCAQLAALREDLGSDELARLLAGGLRLYAEAPALALAA
jgi:hypothetical protein